MANRDMRQVEPGVYQMGNGPSAKTYISVAKRNADFRAKYPSYSCTTEILERSDASVFIKATIADETGRILATGHSEESRSQGPVNRTSAVENGETSAIGRALSNLGFGGEEFASAEEVSGAIIDQAKLEVTDFFAKFIPLVLENSEAIKGLFAAVAADDAVAAAECYANIPSSAMSWFMKVDSDKGGVLSKEVKNYLKSNKDFRLVMTGESTTEDAA